MSLILRPMCRVYSDWNGGDDYAVFVGEMQLGRILRTTQSARQQHHGSGRSSACTWCRLAWRRTAEQQHSTRQRESSQPSGANILNGKGLATDPRKCPLRAARKSADSPAAGTIVEEAAFRISRYHPTKPLRRVVFGSPASSCIIVAGLFLAEPI